MPSRNPVNQNVYDLVTAVIPDPAAGAQLTWACPDNARVQILYLGFIFATDANAANRYPTITATTPAVAQTMAASTIVQTATLTYGWAFVSELPELADLSAQNIVAVPMSPALILEPGDTLDSYVLNIQAGDAITSIITRYKQWVIA